MGEAFYVWAEAAADTRREAAAAMREGRVSELLRMLRESEEEVARLKRQVSARPRPSAARTCTSRDARVRPLMRIACALHARR